MKISATIRLMCFWLIFPALLMSLSFGCRRSTSKPTPDPLAGWAQDFNEQPNRAIESDYTSYIKSLTPGERQVARVSDWRKDGAGQHAIVIEIALDGTWWHHVLIYGKNDVRIKVIKYSPGNYRS